ncbi:ester cyclase [Halobacteriales archaeon Cl-PHB]
MTDEPAEMDPETLVRYGCIETLKQGNIDEADRFYTDDAVYYRSDDDPATVEDLVEDGKQFNASFDDFDATIHETVVDGDEISFRYTFTGTHTGEFQGMPPTGEAVEAQGIGYARLEDGLIAEYSLCFDSLGMFQQLGLA